MQNQLAHFHHKELERHFNQGDWGDVIRIISIWASKESCCWEEFVDCKNIIEHGINRDYQYDFSKSYYQIMGKTDIKNPDELKQLVAQAAKLNAVAVLEKLGTTALLFGVEVNNYYLEVYISVLGELGLTEKIDSFLGQGSNITINENVFSEIILAFGKNGLFKPAADIFERACTVFEMSQKIYLAYIEVAGLCGMMPEIKKAFIACVKNIGPNEDLYHKAIIAYGKTGFLNLAKALYQEACGVFPTSRKIRSGYLSVVGRAGDGGEVKRVFDELQNKKLMNTHVFYQYVSFCLNHEQAADAIPHLKNPANMPFIDSKLLAIYLKKTAFNKKFFNEALSLFKHFMAKNPNEFLNNDTIKALIMAWYKHDATSTLEGLSKTINISVETLNRLGEHDSKENFLNQYKQNAIEASLEAGLADIQVAREFGSISAKHYIDLLMFVQNSEQFVKYAIPAMKNATQAHIRSERLSHAFIKLTKKVGHYGQAKDEFNLAIQNGYHTSDLYTIFIEFSAERSNLNQIFMAIKAAKTTGVYSANLYTAACIALDTLKPSEEVVALRASLKNQLTEDDATPFFLIKRHNEMSLSERIDKIKGTIKSDGQKISVINQLVEMARTKKFRYELSFIYSLMKTQDLLVQDVAMMLLEGLSGQNNSAPQKNVDQAVVSVDKFWDIAICAQLTNHEKACPKLRKEDIFLSLCYLPSALSNFHLTERLLQSLIDVVSEKTSQVIKSSCQFRFLKAACHDDQDEESQYLSKCCIQDLLSIPEFFNFVQNNIGLVASKNLQLAFHFLSTHSNPPSSSHLNLLFSKLSATNINTIDPLDITTLLKKASANFESNYPMIGTFLSQKLKLDLQSDFVDELAVKIFNLSDMSASCVKPYYDSIIKPWVEKVDSYQNVEHVCFSDSAKLVFDKFLAQCNGFKDGLKKAWEKKSSQKDKFNSGCLLFEKIASHPMPSEALALFDLLANLAQSNLDIEKLSRFAQQYSALALRRSYTKYIKGKQIDIYQQKLQAGEHKSAWEYLTGLPISFTINEVHRFLIAGPSLALAHELLLKQFKDKPSHETLAYYLLALERYMNEISVDVVVDALNYFYEVSPGLATKSLTPTQKNNLVMLNKLIKFTMDAPHHNFMPLLQLMLSHDNKTGGNYLSFTQAETPSMIKSSLYRLDSKPLDEALVLSLANSWMNCLDKYRDVDALKISNRFLQLLSEILCNKSDDYFQNTHIKREDESKKNDLLFIFNSTLKFVFSKFVSMDVKKNVLTRLIGCDLNYFKKFNRHINPNIFKACELFMLDSMSTQTEQQNLMGKNQDGLVFYTAYQIYLFDVNNPVGAYRLFNILDKAAHPQIIFMLSKATAAQMAQINIKNYQKCVALALYFEDYIKCAEFEWDEEIDNLLKDKLSFSYDLYKTFLDHVLRFPLSHDVEINSQSDDIYSPIDSLINLSRLIYLVYENPEHRALLKPEAWRALTLKVLKLLMDNHQNYLLSVLLVYALEHHIIEPKGDKYDALKQYILMSQNKAPATAAMAQQYAEYEENAALDDPFLVIDLSQIDYSSYITDKVRMVIDAAKVTPLLPQRSQLALAFWPAGLPNQKAVATFSQSKEEDKNKLTMSLK